MRIRHWSTVAAVAQAVAVGVVYGYFVRTRPGQVRDEVALLAGAMGHDKVQSVADALLHAVPVACLVAAVAVVRHLVREGHRRLAIRSVVLVLGANLTTQAVKRLAGRPAA